MHLLLFLDTLFCLYIYLPIYVLRMKDDRLSKALLFCQSSRAEHKAGRPRLGWKDVIKKDLNEIGTSWEGVKREALNRLG